MNMKVGIDCSAAFWKTLTGVGVYTYNLVHALSRVDKVNSYTLYPVFYNPFRGFEKRDMPVNFKIAHENSRRLLSGVLWPALVPSGLKEAALGEVDIVHSNTFAGPVLKKKKLVSTIYDATVFTHPECHSKGNVLRCRKGIEDSIRNARAIIAISEHTKKDLVERLNAPARMITVTHLAAGPEYHEIKGPSALDAVKKKYALPRNYILFVGSLEPRKNVKTLLKGYASLSETVKREFSLVIAGAKGWLNSDIPGLVKELGIEQKTVFLGYIDKEDMSAVYSAASVFAYPSLYEGFGLPILEAFACGVPVITSNTSSMPEVAGDAAVLVDPADSAELAAALEGLLLDEGKRRELKARGLERAALFSWERCARETIAVYEKVYKGVA